MKALRCFFLSILCGAAACGDDDEPPPPVPNPTKAVTFRVSHPVSTPLAAGAGPVAYVSSDRILAATTEGLVSLDASGQPSAGSWALTSTGAGPAVSAIALSPEDVLAERTAFFLPSMTAQLGALALSDTGGTLAGEAVLAAPLSGTFPAGLLAPATGPGADTLWIADAPFGPGSTLRAYPYAGWTGATLTEDAARSFAPAAADLDGDGQSDQPVIARAVASHDPSLALVAFTILGNTAAGAAGGVQLVDLATGDAAGRVIVPVADTATTTLGYVSSAASFGNWLVVVSSEKAPDFSDVRGTISIYAVASWRPFRLAGGNDADPYHRPAFGFATSVPNPNGVAIVEGRALVVNAPFFSEAALDVVDLTIVTPELTTSLPIGQPYDQGFWLPQDPVVAPDGSALLLGTEKGIVRIEVVEE